MDQVTSRGRQIGVILSGSLAGFMVLLDTNIVNISLPEIAASFSISPGSVVRVTLIYLLILSSTLIIFGKLADKYGLRRIFLSGFSVFTASSLLCGISPSFQLLLVSRMLQALGGAMLFATSIALISKFIPPDRRGWAFGIFSPLSSLGLLVGNPLGGLITGLMNWHWIFLVNVPVGLAAVLYAGKMIPADHSRTDEQKDRKGFDFIGSALSFCGLALLMFFVNQGPRIGWDSPLTLTGLAGAVVLLTGFILWERISRDPILDLTIFRSRGFSLAILASIAGFGVMSGSNVLLPFYLRYCLDVNVTHSGFILMTFAVLFTMCSPITGRLSDRVSKTLLTIIGMSLATLICISFSLLLPIGHLGILFAFMVLLGVSYALFITPNNNLVMSMARPDKQSLSSGVFKLATNLGQMFGIILMEMVFTLSLPPGSGSPDSSLDNIPSDTLLRGFSLAFLSGAGLCFLAIVFSLFIREKEAVVTTPGETAFLG
jgi:EmrB/QacA subfamily drug resistance transporter